MNEYVSLWKVLWLLQLLQQLSSRLYKNKLQVLYIPNHITTLFGTECHYCKIKDIIIHQTHCEKSDWLRAFNQFTIACELDMINAISAADITFTMSSSTSAWLLSPLECSPQKQNGWMSSFAYCLKKCTIKQLLNSVFAWYHELSKPRVCAFGFGR